MKKAISILVVLTLILVSLFMTTINVSAEQTVIREYKGADLTKFANLGPSLDNTGYAQKAENPAERASFTKIVDGNIVFEAAKDEYLPGGFIFTTTTNGKAAGGMKIDEITGLAAGQKVRVVYVINIDPVSTDYSSRLFCIEGLSAGANFGLTGAKDNWGGESIANQISKSWLGKDLEVMSAGIKTASSSGKISAFNLINYTTAHYPKLAETANSSMAAFKITFKAVKIVADGYTVPDFTKDPPAETEKPTQAPTEKPATEKPATEKPSDPGNGNNETGDVSMIASLILAAGAGLGSLKLRKK